MTKQTPQFWFQWILDSLQEGKEVEITANGWSMCPSIKPGSVLTLIKVPIEALKVGDAIAFTRGEHFVVHRVEKIIPQEPFQICSRGDANLSFDEIVSSQNYCGKVNGFVLKPAPSLLQRIFYFLLQLVQINWARAKKIPSLLKRDSAI